MRPEEVRPGRRIEVTVSLSETGDLIVRGTGAQTMRIVAGGGRRLARAAAERVFEILSEEMDARERKPPSPDETKAIEDKFRDAVARAMRVSPFHGGGGPTG